MSGHEQLADRDRQGAAAPVGLFEATRALLWIRSPGEASTVARDLVENLGGTVVKAADADGSALPVDLSFGAGEPMLPSAPPHSVARMQLERYLPSFLVDAQRAVDLAERADRLASDAFLDVLTGLPNRRSLGRSLGRLGPADVVVMLDLDHFKRLNDTLGHEEGDRVLRSFGRVLAGTLRASERAGRFGGEEFVIILKDSTNPDAFLNRLRTVWEEQRPHGVTFSAGVAPAGLTPRSALGAADRALYRAKAAGRDRWIWATVGEYRSEADGDGGPSGPPR